MMLSTSETFASIFILAEPLWESSTKDSVCQVYLYSNYQSTISVPIHLGVNISQVQYLNICHPATIVLGWLGEANPVLN